MVISQSIFRVLPWNKNWNVRKLKGYNNVVLDFQYLFQFKMAVLVGLNRRFSKFFNFPDRLCLTSDSDCSLKTKWNGPFKCLSIFKIDGDTALSSLFCCLLSDAFLNWAIVTKSGLHRLEVFCNIPWEAEPDRPSGCWDIASQSQVSPTSQFSRLSTHFGGRLFTASAEKGAITDYRSGTHCHRV